ncbi:MAG: YhcH/YjgK/YiaL family protein [Clostridia bacterium]|nr:YhcH/YjgK/YiaL family protein [Clostridia bacterium]
MIFDQINHLCQYESLLPGIKAIRRFLSENDPAQLPDTRIQIGGGVFCTVARYITKDDGCLEAHRRYIDLQLILSGSEVIEYAPLSSTADEKDYCEKTDLQFFGGAARTMPVTLSAGDFVILFPHDAHKPGLSPADGAKDICKIVFKIPVREYTHYAHVEQLCTRISLPEDASAAVLAAAKRITADQIEAITARYFADEEISDDIAALAAAIGVSLPLCTLTVYMMLSHHTFYSYIAHGISSDVYYDSMTDFTVWNLESVRQNGAPGLLQTVWLSFTLKEKIYRLGRFQYEPTTFEHPEYILGDRIIRRGDPVISIHIPEGPPMDDEARMDSYRRAEAFFGQNVFVCESWLLYPAHRSFLQQGSNIVRFMDDFVLLRAEEVRGDLSNLWRMYGFKHDLSDFASLPEMTGMQRAYKHHLIETGGMTGGGYGILVIENGTIISK